MKKLLFYLIVLFALFGCAKSNVELNVKEIESYPVDMSGYKGLSSTEHNFRGISPDEMMKVVEDGNSAIIFMGYKGCDFCQEAAQYVNEVAEELDVTVYYLDCKSERYPLKGEMFEKVVDILEPILRTNELGEKTIYTPHVFSIVNGVPQEGHISVVNSWVAGNPSEDSIKELKEIYVGIMKDFAK